MVATGPEEELPPRDAPREKEDLPTREAPREQEDLAPRRAPREEELASQEAPTEEAPTDEAREEAREREEPALLSPLSKLIKSCDASSSLIPLKRASSL